MRSLFLKIFFSFWLTIVLMGVPFYIMALQSRPEHHPFSSIYYFSMQAMAQYGEEALAAYQQGDKKGLRAYAQSIEQQSGISIYLFNGESLLDGQQAPPEAIRAARRIFAEDKKSPLPDADLGKTRWLGRRLAPRSLDKVGEPLAIVLQIPKLPPPPIHLMPHTPLTNILLYSVVGGLVCYFLAHSLTAPIRKLREATNRIASGDFSVRLTKDLGGKGNEVVALSRDFDAMAEQIERLLLTQKRLLRDISHELRSPLARLQVALELARQRAANKEVLSPLDRIGKEAERLNEMIDQIITLTRLESGSKDLTRDEVDLVELLREITCDADFESSNRNCRVTLTPCCTKTIMLQASRELLRRALENVVRNAVHYTAPGTAVEISCLTTTRHAIITVRDHGPGVPAWALNHIFKPFFRVSEARDRQSGGTGVGLAIAERALRMYGGNITAANAQDGGFIITINLPLLPA